MSFTDQEIEEFKTEARELLDQGEKGLLALDGGGTFREHFDAIFRAFHNLKGAAGMMELGALQAHTHELESLFMRFKDADSLPKPYISLFLRGIDASRSILNGQTIQFDYSVKEEAAAAANESEAKLDAIVDDYEKNEPKLELPASAEDEFVTECEETIERFTQALRKIEADDYTKETLDGAYREMHSLKGAAYLFGFNEMGDIAHAMESALEPVRDGEHWIGKLLIDGLYKAIECIELEIQFLKKKMPNEQIKTLAPAIIRILNAASKQAAEAASRYTETPQEESAPEAAVAAPAPSSAPIAQATAKAPAEPAMAQIEAKPAPQIHMESAPAPQPEASLTTQAVNEVATVTANAQAAAAANTKEAEAASSIRVPVALLDNLMTLMGEMVLVRNQVLQYSNESEDLNFLNLSQRLNVVTSELQGEMMKTRMQPIGNILNKFHRVVRDLSHELKKNITLNLTGAETELDKTLLEAIKDPLTHIVRNSCDHGIETADVRRRAGKHEGGSITIKSYHEGGQVVIEVTDDGKGLHKAPLLKKAIEKNLITEAQAAQMSEKEIFNLIFAPGFSTAAAITNLSGRGVGMDVVRTNIEKIGGTVDLSSVAGHGTTIRLKIPLTLAIVPALIVHGSQGTFAIPQVKLIELVRVDQAAGMKIEFLQGAPVYRLRGNILPLVDLNHVLGGPKRDFRESGIINVAVLNAESHAFGLIVDSIDDTADIVVKPLNRLLKSLQVYSGATLLGDGSVALILDVHGIARVAQLQAENKKSTSALNEAAEKWNSDFQDFLLVRVNSPTKHAIVLSYVHRLEEFKRSDVELSGSQRVVRYRKAVLPIISANEHMGFGASAPSEDPMIKVVVIERGGRLFGIEVDEILDTLSTDVETDTKTVTQKGVIGNLSTEQELIVVMDPFALITFAFPNFNHEEPPARKHVPAELASEHLAEASGPKRILLVEDSPFFKKLVKGILEEAGHNVTTAADGQLAVEILERSERPFDLIVSDIEMPRMNGFQLATAIRASAVHSKTPLLALSSKRDKNHLAQGAKVGFNIYLEKIKPEILLGAISDLTNTRKSA